MRRCLPIAVPIVLAGIAAAPGCVRLESDYELQLEPRTPVDQTPFDRGPTVKLVIRQDVGMDVVPLGVPGRGTIESDGLGKLEDAHVGLALELPTNDDVRIDPDRLLAYGEAGPFTLSTGDDPVSESVLVAEYAHVGGLDALPVPLFGAAMALTERGDVALFGGVTSMGTTTASDQVLVLTDLDNGDWRFAPAGLMPEVSGASGRYDAAAARATFEGDPAVLVTGGRTVVDDPLSATTTAVAWDPVGGLPVWSGDVLRVPRAGHTAVTLTNGRVLLVGGDRDEETGEGLATSTFEVFDPAFLATSLGQQELAVPSTGFAAADLGADGVLLCGGSSPISGGAEPSDACSRVSVLANVQNAASLPVAVQFAAMTAVGDGLVLLSGGSLTAISGSGIVPATDRAFLYDVATNTWTETGPMAHPRALHALIPTPDGRVVVVGGVGAAGLDEAVGDAVDCVELFDPVAGEFTETQCTGTGAGAWPLVSTTDTDGAFVLSGRDGDGVGGAAYGVVGVGPVR